MDGVYSGAVYTRSGRSSNIGPPPTSANSKSKRTHSPPHRRLDRVGRRPASTSMTRCRWTASTHPRKRSTWYAPGPTPGRTTCSTPSAPHGGPRTGLDRNHRRRRRARHGDQHGGWSGNESLMAALHENVMIVALCWESAAGRARRLVHPADARPMTSTINANARQTARTPATGRSSGMCHSSHCGPLRRRSGLSVVAATLVRSDLTRCRSCGSVVRSPHDGWRHQCAVPYGLASTPARNAGG